MMDWPEFCVWHRTKNRMRVDPRMTIATRTARFGRSSRGNSRLWHLTDEVAIYWDGDRPVGGARWKCGGATLFASLSDVEPASVCARCITAEADMRLKQPVVYFAHRRGLIKIGFSMRPRRRVDGLAAELLALEPGGRQREAELHHQFDHLRVAGEWFRPADDLMSYIGSLPQAEAVA